MCPDEWGHHFEQKHYLISNEKQLAKANCSVLKEVSISKVTQEISGCLTAYP
jgi:hypothetical protein